MRKNKITILILGIVGALIFGNQIVLAQDSPSVFISPANLTKNVGDNFDLAVKVNPGGQKVCAIEGQLTLSKLIVQKIDIADGIISQTPPSFSNNFYFLLGIPGCTTQEKTLFTIRVKTNTIGKASVGFRNVDIIGEGMSVSSAFVGGNYEIVIPKAPVSREEGQKPGVKPCVCGSWSSWQSKGCGEGGCLDTQRLQVRNRNCNPAGCDIEEQIQCLNDSACIASAKRPKVNINEIKGSTHRKSLLASIGSTIALGTGRTWAGILFLSIIVISIIFLLSKKGKIIKRKKE